jgi:WD40 repeat protein
MKKIGGLWIIYLFLIDCLVAQETLTLDAAISNASRNLNIRLPYHTKVAVLNFQANTIDLSNYVHEAVNKALARNPLLTVVDRRNLIPLLREANLQLSDELSDGSAQAIARKLGAQSFITGSFFQTGAAYYFKIQGVSTQNSQVYWANTYQIRQDAAFTALLETGTGIGDSTAGSNRPTDPLSLFKTYREIQTLFGHQGIIYAVAYSPDGSRIVSGSYDGTVKVWDANNGQEIKTFSGQGGTILSVAYSPDGRRIGSGSTNSTIRIWDVETGAYHILSGHSGFVRALAYSPDGQRLVSGSGDKTLKIWDANTGKELRTLRTLGGHTSTVYAVAYSPDGRRLLSGSEDTTIMLWDEPRGIAIRTLGGHKNAVYSVAWSPEGNRILSGSADKTLKIWDPETGKELMTLSGHTGTVWSVVYTPDGKGILSGSEDKTFKIWDPESGWEVKSIPSGHSGAVRSLVFSPDGKQFISCSDDRTIKIWGTE